MQSPETANIYENLLHDKDGISTEEKTAYSIYGVGTTGYPSGKVRLISHIIYPDKY